MVSVKGGGFIKDVALIFPGQGAQKVGMGLEFYQTSRECKMIFELAAAACASDFLKIMFEGPEERLTQTVYCQPAILAVSIAAFTAFKMHDKFRLVNVKYAAGLSLGEYSALAASNTISFNEALSLVQERGALMDEACLRNKGSMAAVIGFDQNKLLEICAQAGVEVANFNSLEQTVITGPADKVVKAIEAIKAAGGQKVIPLNVAGAFHSSLMKPAADKFRTSRLRETIIRPTTVGVISNVDGLPHFDAEIIRENLVKQITSSVQWVKTIEYIVSQGIMNFIEIGPGKVLKGLMRRIVPEARVFNIEKPQDIDALAFDDI